MYFVFNVYMFIGGRVDMRLGRHRHEYMLMRMSQEREKVENENLMVRQHSPRSLKPSLETQITLFHW